MTDKTLPPSDKNSALVEAAWNAVTALERDTYTPLMRSIAATKLREAIGSAASHALENDGSDRRRRNIGHEPERRVTNGSVRDASVASTTPRSQTIEEAKAVAMKATLCAQIMLQNPVVVANEKARHICVDTRDAANAFLAANPE